MQYRHEIEHAPANFALQRYSAKNYSTFVFRKYRRAQIALFHAYTASVALAFQFLQSFASQAICKR